MKKLILFTMFLLCALFLFAQTDTLQVVSSKWDELKLNIFGNILTPIGYISCYIFVFFGLIIKWYIQTRKAIKTNPRTPEKFNLKYWFWDNLLPKLQSLLVSGIIIFVCLRFSLELFKMYASMFLALGIGLGFDFIIDVIKRKIPDVIKAKEAFIKENKENTGSPAQKDQ